jgi:iron(III) transport system permease protein
MVRTKVARSYPDSAFRFVIGGLTVVVGLLIAWPIGRMLYYVFFPDSHFVGLSSFRDAFTAPGIGSVISQTLILVACVAPLSLIVGTALAWINERTDARLGFLSNILPLVPLLIPVIAVVVGWVFLFSSQAGLVNIYLRRLLLVFGVRLTSGPLNVNSWPGLIFASVLEVTPFVYLAMSAAFRNFNCELEEASRVSGSGWFRTLIRVTLPASRTALGNAFLIAVAISFALYTSPLIIGAPINVSPLSVHIYQLMTGFPPATDQAAAFGLVLMVLLGLIWFLQSRWRRGAGESTVQTRATQFSRMALGRWRVIARLFTLGYLVVAVLLPLIALILVTLEPFWTGTEIPFGKLSLAGFRQLFAPGSTTLLALEHSYVLAAVCATVGALVLSLAAHGLRRNALGRRVYDGLTRLPIALPQVVVAVGIILGYSGAPFELADTFLILGICYLVLYIPVASLMLGTTSNQVPAELTEASTVSGAREARTYFRVVLPLTIPGVVAAWSIIFVLTVSDLISSSMLAGVNTPVVGSVLLNQYTAGSFQTTAALCTVVTLSTTIVIALSRLVTRVGIRVHPRREPQWTRRRPHLTSARSS